MLTIIGKHYLSSRCSISFLWCPFNCTYFSLDFNWLIQHAWNNHGLENDVSFKCDVLGCHTQFIYQRSNKNHVRTKHREFHQTNLVCQKSSYSPEALTSDIRPQATAAATTTSTTLARKRTAP